MATNNTTKRSQRTIKFDDKLWDKAIKLKCGKNKDFEFISHYLEDLVRKDFKKNKK